MHKIEFTIQHTVLQYKPLMLDGLIAKFWLQKYHPESFFNKPMYAPDELFDFSTAKDFPIEFDAEAGCFLASQIFLTGNVQSFITSEKKRWNEQSHWVISDKERTGIDTQRGTMKSANIPRTGFVCSGAVAWFCGDADKVAEILQDIVGIGKKVSKGYGWIRDVKISACNGNFWDTLKRPAPLEFAAQKKKTGSIFVMRTMPPYHQQIGAVPCVVPSSDKNYTDFLIQNS